LEGLPYYNYYYEHTKKSPKIQKFVTSIKLGKICENTKNFLDFGFLISNNLLDSSLDTGR
jgi:hypothetical protein